MLNRFNVVLGTSNSCFHKAEYCAPRSLAFRFGSQSHKVDLAEWCRRVILLRFPRSSGLQSLHMVGRQESPPFPNICSIGVPLDTTVSALGSGLPLYVAFRAASPGRELSPYLTATHLG